MRRRSVVLSAVSGVLTSALAVRHSASAQTEDLIPPQSLPGATPAALAEHPLSGTWVVMSTGGAVPQTHHADGSLIAAAPPTYVDPALGLTFQGPALGQWEPTGERTGRFTFLQALSDGDGAYVGTFQLADELEVSEDGQTWSGSHEAHIIMRDASNAVIVEQVIPFETPVTATRVGATLASVVIPETTSTPGTATP